MTAANASVTALFTALTIDRQPAARYSCTCAIVLAPSPTAEATRLTEP